MVASRGDTKDASQGILVADLTNDILQTHVDGEDVLILKRDSDIFAIGAHCTHYHGPLADGLVVGDTIRCPWHHACFALPTGEAVRAPALDPVACWRVERSGDKIFVREKLAPPAPKTASSEDIRLWPESVVIIGGGAGGLAAADMLRREGYPRPLTMLSAEDAPPCDRPNLSKDYLAGKAPEDWIPVRPPDYYSNHHIELVLNARVSGLDLEARTVAAEGGRTYPFGALLIAPGADP